MSTLKDKQADLPPPAVPTGATREAFADGMLLLDRLSDGRAAFHINRPESRNTLTLPLLEALAQAIDALGKARCPAAMISGVGGKAFSSGLDIHDLDNRELHPEADVGADGFYELDRRLSAALGAVEGAPFPVLAVIDGWCIGAGLELAMACDLRIATAGSRFRMPPARIGWVYSMRGLSRFTAAIGEAHAKWLFLTAEVLPDERAFAMGLIHEIVPPEALAARAEQLTKGMLDAAPIALAGLKQALAALAAPTPHAEDFARHVDWRRRAIASHDLAEGRRAFLEHRPPKFTGA